MWQSFQETVFRLRAAQWAMAALRLGRGLVRRQLGQRYRAICDFCWVTRVTSAGPLGRIADRFVAGTVQGFRTAGRNTLIDDYRADSASQALAASYALTGRGGPHDLFRDLIVLKRATGDEKGVILLKYGRTFDAVVSMFDLSRLMQRYTFVLEPCWAGYSDPSLLMFVAPGNPVVVQCFTEEDFQFIVGIGSPFVPVRLGPADWVDAALFAPNPAGLKTHDLVMVANWAPHKRHAVLFDALRRVTDRKIRVLLIGFPWGGRTAEDIRREADAIGNQLVEVEVLEKISPREVALHVGRCKVFVFLSRKEGDNKALVEAMFTGLPAIVYDRTIGGARSRINASTGVFSSEAELLEKMLYMLDHHQEFSPRAWVLAHSGSSVAARTLDDALRQAVRGAGGVYNEAIVEKRNSPNLAYEDARLRLRFQADYDFILSCRLNGSVRLTDAVA